jgi:hypothetical protein
MNIGGGMNDELGKDVKTTHANNRCDVREAENNLRNWARQIDASADEALSIIRRTQALAASIGSGAAIEDIDELIESATRSSEIVSDFLELASLPQLAEPKKSAVCTPEEIDAMHSLNVALEAKQAQESAGHSPRNLR